MMRAAAEMLQTTPDDSLGDLQQAIREWADEQVSNSSAPPARVRANQKALLSLAQAYHLPLVRCVSAPQRRGLTDLGLSAALYCARFVPAIGFPDDTIGISMRLSIVPIAADGRMLEPVRDETSVGFTDDSSQNLSPREIADWIAKASQRAESKISSNDLAKVDNFKGAAGKLLMRPFDGITWWLSSNTKVHSVPETFVYLARQQSTSVATQFALLGKHLPDDLRVLSTRPGSSAGSGELNLLALSRAQRLSQRDRKALLEKLSDNPLLFNHLVAESTTQASLRALAAHNDSLHGDVVIPERLRWSTEQLQARAQVGHGLPAGYVELLCSLTDAQRQQMPIGNEVHILATLPDRLLPRTFEELLMARDVASAGWGMQQATIGMNVHRPVLIRSLVETSLDLPALHRMVSGRKTSGDGIRKLFDAILNPTDEFLGADLRSRIGALPFEDLYALDQAADRAQNDLLAIPLPEKLGYPPGTSPQDLVTQHQARWSAGSQPADEYGRAKPAPARSRIARSP